MSPTDCGDVREAASEFALGILDGAVRSEVVVHLDHCQPCRAVVGELAEAADALVTLAPEAEPPPGFGRRVVGAITGAERRRRWRTAKLVAAAVAAAAIVSVVAVRVIDDRRDGGDGVTAAETVAVVGTDGVKVGEVEVVSDGPMASLALRVDYALPDGDYRVVLDPPAGTRQALGTVAVRSGRGTWAGSARVDERPVDLALVDHGGRVHCSARLPLA